MRERAAQIPKPASAATPRRKPADAAKSAFLRMVSHELRTPLNSIIGFSEILSRELYGPIGQPRYRDYAEIVLQSGHRLLALVNQILEIVRLQEGAADLGICNVQMANGGQGATGLQSRPYRSDHLVLVVPQAHDLSGHAAISFEEILDWDIVGLHANSSISLAMRTAAATAGRPLRQRIQVTGLDAMCRMIDNGLGVGLLPDRAFELMRGVGRLTAVPLTDAWAHRELRVVARDFDTLPVTARLLAEHLAPRADAAPAPDGPAQH